MGEPAGAFVYLALGGFAVAAEQRRKGAELEPSQIELPPFVNMGGILFGIAILQRETAYIVRPVGNARHRQIDARGYLVPEVIPARCDVAGPDRCSSTLDAPEAGPGQNEWAHIGLRNQLPLIDAFAMHQREAVEERCPRSFRSRAHAVGAFLDRKVRVEIRLVRVEPPGIEAQIAQIFADLPPVNVLCLGVIGIVKGVSVTRPDPVAVHFRYIFRIL